MHHPTDRITHTPVMEQWLEQEIAQWEQIDLCKKPTKTKQNKANCYEEKQTVFH